MVIFHSYVKLPEGDPSTVGYFSMAQLLVKIGFYPHHTPVKHLSGCQLKAPLWETRTASTETLTGTYQKAREYQYKLKILGISEYRFNSVHICCTFMYFHIYTLTIQKTCCKTWAQSWLKLWSLDWLNQRYFLPITQTQKHVQKSYWMIWKNIIYVKHTNNQKPSKPTMWTHSPRISRLTSAPSWTLWMASGR